MYFKPQPQECVLSSASRVAPFSRRPGSWGAGYSSQRGRVAGRRSGATSCSRSWAARRACCSSSSPSCMSSGRWGWAWGSGGGSSLLGTGLVPPELTPTEAGIRGYIRPREEKCLCPPFLSESAGSGGSGTSQGHSAGERSAGAFSCPHSRPSSGSRPYVGKSRRHFAVFPLRSPPW